eukprot:2294825-Karenia_brevis.AAC.1
MELYEEGRRGGCAAAAGNLGVLFEERGEIAKAMGFIIIPIIIIIMIIIIIISVIILIVNIIIVIIIII